MSRGCGDPFWEGRSNNNDLKSSYAPVICDSKIDYVISMNLCG
jgi:hypothetical protein